MNDIIKNKATPVMKQFWGIKDKHPNSIILFRMGDFYETFEKDAEITSDILGIALTKRANGAASSVPLAGFPYHALNQYLYKLLKAGHRVAICEQVEDPKEAKGIVKREVVEIVSPGTTIADNYLDNNFNNYLCCAYNDGKAIGVSLLDHSTGEFFATEVYPTDFNNIISKYNVAEILILESQKDIFAKCNSIKNIVINFIPDWVNDYDYTNEILCNHFKVKNMKGFGFSKKSCSIISSGIIMHYIKENFQDRVNHINSLKTLPYQNIMQLDYYTIRNLELFSPLLSNNKKSTLIYALDKTVTSSGSRLFKNWIARPLIDKLLINNRLNHVQDFFDDEIFIENTRLLLKKTHDIERIIAKISSNKCNPLDILNLSTSLKTLNDFKGLIPKKSSFVKGLFKNIFNSKKIISVINNTLIENPPVNMNKGYFIKDGFSNKLDELRSVSNDANEWMLNYQIELRKETNIPSLKISFNKVFGYYIDVTKTHINKVPDYFIKKQTLVNNERFFTDELKDFEDKILNVDYKINQLENEIFNNLCKIVMNVSNDIQSNAYLISKIDIFSSLAYLAINNKYIRPIINQKFSLKIKNGRHPVVENLISDNNQFIANDISLDNHQFLSIITGPNMSGKSTYLRQIGIIIIMAQIGSFVPADYAEIGIVDKLFTRVGASDNLSEGESTFLVEMQETANIINNATKNSLILLDEIGRGTSTYDGLSIAWAVTEFIHNKIKAKTLFATHYHELVDLANNLKSANNLNILVEESSDKSDIVFLRKIVEGGTDKSYGIYVAKMAGLPSEIITKSKIYLELLTQDKKKVSLNDTRNIESIISKINQDHHQVSSDLVNSLKSIDVNNISPIEALNLLSHIIKKYVK